MRTSKFYLNFCRIFRQTRFGAHPSFPVCRLYNRCRVQLVSTGLCLFLLWKKSNLSDYASRMRSLNLPLRLLTENEIFRLSVWMNPANDPKKGSDLVGNTERTLLEVIPQFPSGSNTWRLLDLLAWNCPHSVADQSRNCSASYRAVQNRVHSLRSWKISSLEHTCCTRHTRSFAPSTGREAGSPYS